MTGVQTWALPISNGITEINDNVFDTCTGLTEIIIPDNITAIGESAFNNCYGLTDLEIGKNVKLIGRGAFNGCSGLKNVIIPNNVEYVFEKAFWNCSNLESITFENPYCIIYDDYKTIPGATTIYGYSNSNAQIYASNYDREFIVIVENNIGDVNGDNIVSIMDATTIQKYLAGLSDFTAEQLHNADVNGDGVVSILDATNIQKYLVGLVEI